ncbi:hypothetical protein Pfo_031398 [Paulownia fortunei]|nr:hypothetical protein Pfo_031398 [Paulownia fortunei]
MEQIHERIDQVKSGQREQPQNNHNVCKREGVQLREVRDEEKEYYGGNFNEKNDPNSSVGNRSYGRWFRETRNWEDNNLSSLKMNIPLFQGKNDPETYLEWEKKVELVFDCHNYSELKKVKLAVIEFFDYAIIWWDKLILNRRINRECSISTWEDMKSVMRRRFVPSYYYQELYQNVEDYFKKMEITMIRANVEEDREATMARFLVGLNSEIANLVELQHYVELEDMRRGSNIRQNPSSSSSWRPNFIKKEEKPTMAKSKTEQKSEMTSHGNQGKSNSYANWNHDIKCFKCQSPHIASKCLNKRVMVLRDDGEFEIDNEDNTNSMPQLEEADDEKYATQGELLVARRALKNIFYTRCHVQNKVCSVIIDGCSCTNVAITTMVEKLGMPTTKHPDLTSCNGLNDSGEVRVNKQVLVSFCIRKYDDEILGDVVPIVIKKKRVKIRKMSENQREKEIKAEKNKRENKKSRFDH